MEGSGGERVKKPWTYPWSSFSSSSALVLFIKFTCLSILIPQFTQGAYNEQYLDSMGCSSLKKINLANFANNTLVLKLSRWEDYHLPSAFMNFQCGFQVIAPKGHGIMAVTQGLHLRTKNKQAHTCRDYIKFQQNDGREAGPICGEVNVTDHSMSPKSLIGPRTFYDPSGVMDVFFSSDDSDPSEVQKPIFLQLVFTTYKECTTIDLLTHRIRSCSEGKGNACIASNLFCDGIINCGFRGDFAADEINCDGGEAEVEELNIDPPTSPFDNNKINTLSKNSRADTMDEGMGVDPQFNLHGPLSVHVFALISATIGGLIVLLLILVCCCLGRFGRLSPRNASLRQQAQPQEGQGHPGSSIAINPSYMSRLTPSSILVKPREDLPPPYDAIFPQPNHHEKK